MNNTSSSLLLTAASLAAGASLAIAGEAAPAKKTVTPVEREDIAVHPITSPYWNEDATITTDVRPVFVYHNFYISVIDFRMKIT